MNTPGTDDHCTDERENLCALFDGELQGDAARFALKRLGHDAQWRQACGRWQFYGDVLRGQAMAVAGRRFADGIAQAVAQEPTPAAIVSTATQSRTGRPVFLRRGWIGGALAASVAIAGLLVIRPFSNDGAAVGAADTQVVAAAPAAAVPVPAVVIPSADQEVGLAAAAGATMEMPRRVVERRSARSQGQQRTALRSSEQPRLLAPATAVAVASTSAAPVLTEGVAIAAKPFQPEHSEVTARPWPRAVLPQYSGNAGITASYDSGVSSPSFYPFQPSMVEPGLTAPATVPSAVQVESTAPQR